MESELCVTSTLPVTCTVCHCIPTSPNPPSLNWLPVIRPLLVAALTGLLPVAVPAGPLGATGGTDPLGAACVGPAWAGSPNSFWPVVMEPTLLTPGWICRPLCCVATRPPTVTWDH